MPATTPIGLRTTSAVILRADSRVIGRSLRRCPSSSPASSTARGRYREPMASGPEAECTDMGCLLFVSLTGHYGGPTRSLATLLPLVGGGFTRVLVAPGNGQFTT